MKGKLIAACMALAAFVAFAVVPATASAIELQAPTGTKLAAGTLIKATNVGETLMKNDTGTETLIRCNKAEMTGELLTNGPATATGNITSNKFTGTAASEDCTSSTGAGIKVTTGITGGLPYCMKTIELKDEMEIRGGKCSETARSIKFTLDATGIGNCGYETAKLIGSFVTDTSGQDLTATITAGSNSTFNRFESEGLVSIFCPEHSTLEMTFTLEKDEATANPIYAK
ncbi:MAG TPA: hypothetical protein VG448_00425 [Solirubrobacterales bacterium]|nr:hypothetical protein [Solirubrobacterales bacterium]